MDKFSLGKTALIKVIWPMMNLHCPAVSGIILLRLFLSVSIENTLTDIISNRKLSKEYFFFFKEYFWFAGYLSENPFQNNSLALKIFEMPWFSKGSEHLAFFTDYF